MNVVIATRKSILAQKQSEIVGDMLKEKYNIDYEKFLVVTEGDKRLDVTLNKIGGKGLFTKEVEIALLDNRAEIAVHSMKDLPYEIPKRFCIAAILEREDVRDVFVSRDGIHFEDLRQGAVIGTSSIRRGVLLKSIRPDLKIMPVRGNVQTRIQKMKDENMDGIILAAAGMKRLSMEENITDYFDPMVFLPAIGQGALGVECMKSNPRRELFEGIDDTKTRISVEAERSFMRRLNGDCHSLIGAYTIIDGDRLYMIGTYMIDGRIIKKDIEGNIEDYIGLGIKLGEKIIKGE